MKRKVIVGIVVAGAYFALAYYFKVSHVEVVPRRDDVAVIMRLLKTGTPGVFYAHLWLPTYATKATIYQNGARIGEANTVYDDPTRAWVFGGRRWKFVEFNSKSDRDGDRYWVVFR